MTPAPSARSRRLAAAVLTAGALVATAALAACSTSGSGTVADDPVVSSTAPSTPSSPPVVSSPSTPSSAPSASSPSLPTSTPPPSTASSTSSAPPPPPPTSSTPSGPAGCTAQQLTISLVRGGAIQHRQLAGLIFTNTSATPCTVLGFPFAQLVKGGTLLGKPASPSGSPGRGVLLTKGRSAQAQLTATTDCSAPLSDHVRVRAPGQSASTDVADTLRACTLTVGAVEPG